MYNVYSDNKIIRFANVCCGSDAVAALSPRDPEITAKVIEKLGNYKNLCVKCDDPEAVFAAFRGGFAQVEAAGGVVRNPAGDTLMILRGGRWDLPKGHLDPGEDCMRCAEREVKEECGLENLEVGAFILKTYHMYMRRGQWMLKETHWYAMTSGDTVLTPQTEEGIEKAEWVAARDVAARLEEAYPMIAEVLAADACGRPGEQESKSLF